MFCRSCGLAVWAARAASVLLWLPSWLGAGAGARCLFCRPCDLAVWSVARRSSQPKQPAATTDGLASTAQPSAVGSGRPCCSVNLCCLSSCLCLRALILSPELGVACLGKLLPLGLRLLVEVAPRDPCSSCSFHEVEVSVALHELFFAEEHEGRQTTAALCPRPREPAAGSRRALCCAMRRGSAGHPRTPAISPPKPVVKRTPVPNRAPCSTAFSNLFSSSK